MTTRTSSRVRPGCCLPWLLLLCAMGSASFLPSATAATPLLPACSAESVTWPLPSTCSVYLACHSALCQCASAGVTNADGTCSVAAASSCAATQLCLRAFAECVAGVAENRTSSEATCAALGESIYLTKLSAIASGFAASNYLRSCYGLVCNTTNGTCTYTDDGHPCTAIETTSFTPHPTIAGVQYLLRAEILFTGSNFPLILGNETRHALMVSAVIQDMAAYIGIPADSIAVFDLRGAMEVDIGVLSDLVPVTLQRLIVSVNSIPLGPTFTTRSREVYALANDGNSTGFAVTQVVVLSTLPPVTEPFVATDYPTPVPAISGVSTVPSAQWWSVPLAAAVVALAATVG